MNERWDDQFAESPEETADRWRAIKAKRRAEGKCWQCAQLLAACRCFPESTSAAGAHSPEGQRVSDGHEAARQDDPKKSVETKGAQPEPADCEHWNGSFCGKAGACYRPSCKPKAEPVSARPASEPTPPDWRHVETLIDEAVEGYVMEGDSGCYTPTEHERVLIKDCIMGLTADREFLDALRPSFPVQAEAPQITGGWTSGTVQGSK